MKMKIERLFNGRTTVNYDEEHNKIHKGRSEWRNEKISKGSAELHSGRLECNKSLRMCRTAGSVTVSVFQS